MSIWRDIDGDRSRIGLVVHRHGASLYVGRRLYRGLRARLPRGKR